MQVGHKEEKLLHLEISLKETIEAAINLSATETRFIDLLCEKCPGKVADCLWDVKEVRDPYYYLNLSGNHVHAPLMQSSSLL